MAIDTSERTYFVSRHAGAWEWAARQGIKAEMVADFDPNTIRSGDVVLGTLSVPLVAEVCARGGRYFALIHFGPRGRELTADELERNGAHLEEYVARAVR